jgi:hypothetical protein
VTDPGVVAAITSGAVASAAIVASVITTWLTLRYQRNAEGQRRQHERRLRIFDSGLTAAVDFLEAADRTTHARQGLDSASRAFDNAKSSADEKTFEHFRMNVKEAQELTFAAITDAENAYTALRLLVPSVTDQARRYLDLCVHADIHPDEKKVERQRARQMAEEAIRRALGCDLPWQLGAETGEPTARIVEDPAAAQG